MGKTCCSTIFDHENKNNFIITTTMNQQIMSDIQYMERQKDIVDGTVYNGYMKRLVMDDVSGFEVLVKHGRGILKW